MSSPASANLETADKLPKLITPSHGRGKIWQGHPEQGKYLPNPGPGAPSKEAKRVQRKLSECYQAEINEHGTKVAKAVSEKAQSGDIAAVRELREATEGQKIILQVSWKESIPGIIDAFIEAAGNVERFAELLGRFDDPAFATQLVGDTYEVAPEPCTDDAE